jgi:hypothetical protein
MVGMLDDKTIETLGTPSIRLSGFQIWVHGREFPDHHDHWDGNWLKATAHCAASGASVFATGAILHLTELLSWHDQLVRLNRTLIGEANLVCIESYVGVKLQGDALGHITAEVSITPERLTQRHWFQFALDQTYLGALLGQLKSLLGEYSLRGSRD